MGRGRVQCASALAVIAMAATGGLAHAGGFAVKENSTSAQGASFAGATAGANDITYSYVNPAALGTVDSFAVGFNSSVILPSAEADTPQGEVDPGELALVPAFYIGRRITDRAVIGLSTTSPFGLATEYEKDWYGQRDAYRSDLRTVAVTPTLAYNVNDHLTLGAGLTVMYGELIFENAIAPGDVPAAAPALGGLPNGTSQELHATGFAYGFTAGLTYDMLETTRIGVAFRSGFNFYGKGSTEVAGAEIDDNSTAAGDLPAVFSVGIRHEITDDIALLGEAQWQEWSVLDSFRVDAAGTTTFDAFNYDDAFYFAGGAEWSATEDLILRAGVAWDETPTNDIDRSARIPDEDRIWLSAGASYDITERFTVDLAYSFLTLADGDAVVPVDASGFVAGDDDTLNYDASVHIFSVGGSFKY